MGIYLVSHTPTHMARLRGMARLQVLFFDLVQPVIHSTPLPLPLAYQPPLWPHLFSHVFPGKARFSAMFHSYFQVIQGSPPSFSFAVSLSIYQFATRLARSSVVWSYVVSFRRWVWSPLSYFFVICLPPHSSSFYLSPCSKESYTPKKKKKLSSWCNGCNEVSEK